MKSMTGYGRGTCEVAGRRLVVELRSVNHRFLELKLRLPWSDAALEAHITAAVRARLARGAVTVNVRDEGGGGGQAVHADAGLARQYHHALMEIRAAVGLDEPVSLALIASQPGVITVGESVSDPEALWRAMAPGLEVALDALVAARAREGEALRVDLRARLTALETIHHDLGALTQEAPDHYRKKVRDRLERALKPGELDAQRLAQEIAILADKADVTEELTRMAAHLVECKRLTDENGANGRRLDFLTQELNREVNTIGAKSQSATVAARVVDAKAEVERLREQIQNVE
ncbi:MAG TPA: YicC/YloC family endoribonuclease [Polyangia bacterium]|nr:YicC/YloC family endoribonuclease [Polyangia bacterium]